MEIYDVIILGAGPAGLTAAIYANRMELKILVIEKGAPGGKLLNTHIVENYPGIKKTGPEVALEFYNHVRSFNIQIIQDEILEVQGVKDKIKNVYTKNNKVYRGKTIIIATGMNPRRLNVKNYDKFYGRGISTCLICDGSFYRNKDIAVIGGGNSALEESLFAANIVNKINIINISDSPSAFPGIVNTVKKFKNIEIYNNLEVLRVEEEENKIVAITAKNLKNKEEIRIAVSGVFTYIGWISTAIYLKDNNEILNKDGYILTDEIGKTTYPGIFAAGDIREKRYKQVTTATSDGTVAALAAKQYLDDLINEK